MLLLLHTRPAPEIFHSLPAQKEQLTKLKRYEMEKQSELLSWRAKELNKCNKAYIMYVCVCVFAKTKTVKIHEKFITSETRRDNTSHVHIYSNIINMPWTVKFHSNQFRLRYGRNFAIDCVLGIFVQSNKRISTACASE